MRNRFLLLICLRGNTSLIIRKHHLLYYILNTAFAVIHNTCIPGNISPRGDILCVYVFYFCLIPGPSEISPRLRNTGYTNILFIIVYRNTNQAFGERCDKRNFMNSSADGALSCTLYFFLCALVSIDFCLKISISHLVLLRITILKIDDSS